MTTYPGPHEALRTAMISVHQQPDSGLLPVELSAIDSVCNAVESITRDDTDAQAWHRAAVATKRLLRDHSPEVVTEWQSAFAALPPMEYPADGHRV